MENTKQTPPIEDKVKFLAHYYGQKVMSYHNQSAVYKLIAEDLRNENNYLELKPLSKITYEDAIEVANFQDWEMNFNKYGHRFIRDQITVSAKRMWANFLTIDYLRSKGYAVPFMEHSVEDLVSFGWVKLLNE